MTDLDATRARQSRHMRARCTITRPGDGDAVTNRETGAVTPPAGDRVYPVRGTDGVCSIQDGPGIGSLVRMEGGEDVAVRSWVLRLPFQADALEVRRGDVVTITQSDNPALIDHPLYVHGPDLRGRQVTVMLVLTERSYQAVT